MSADWQGTLYLARDFVLLHGQAGATAAHAHYAHQLLISPAAPVTVVIEGRTEVAQCILVESMREHAIVSALAPLFTVYAEPLALEAGTLARLDARAATADALLRELSVLPRHASRDNRIVQALAQVDALLDGKVRAADIAAHAALSLSQLERLFAAHVGLPVRRLVRWRRLRLALALALEGRSLTESAHAAGFADSAHFSRVMREMFGVRADRTLSGLSLRLLS